MCPTFLSLVDFYVPFAAVCSTAGEKEEEEGFLVPLSTRVGFPANYYYVDMENSRVGRYVQEKKGQKMTEIFFFEFTHFKEILFFEQTGSSLLKTCIGTPNITYSFTFGFSFTFLYNIGSQSQSALQHTSSSHPAFLLCVGFVHN